MSDEISNWTKEVPREEGLYWYKDTEFIDRDIVVISVCEVIYWWGRLTVEFIGERETYDFSELKYIEFGERIIPPE